MSDQTPLYYKASPLVHHDDYVRNRQRERQRHNPFADALAFDIEANMPKEDASADEIMDFAQKARDKKSATIAMGLINYQAQKNPQESLNNLWIAETLQINPSQITKDNIEALKGRAIQKNYEQTINQWGVLPDEVMTDPDFLKFVSADDYKYIKALRDLGEKRTGQDGFFNTIGRAWDYSKAEYDSDVALALNPTREEAQARLDKAFANDYLYKRDDDGVGFDALTVISDQFNPYREEEWRSLMPLAGVALGVITKNPKVAQFGLVAGDALATYESRLNQQIGRDLTRIYNENNEIDLEQAKETITDEASIVVGLDYISNIAGAVLGGSVVNAIGKLGKTALKGEKAVETASLAKRTAQSLTSAFKDFGIAWTTEVATEGVQGAISQKGVDEALGKELDISRLIDAGIREGKEAMSVMAVIAGTGAGFKGTVDIARHALSDYSQANKDKAQKAVTAMQDLAEQTSMAEINRANSLNEAEPRRLNNIIRKINQHKVFIKASDLNNYIKSNNIDTSKLDETYATLDADSATDPDKLYSIHEADIYTVLLSDNYTDLLRNSKRTVDGITPNEAKAFKDTIDIDEFINGIKDRRARDREQQEIKADVFNSLVQMDTSTKPEQLDALAQFVADSYSSLSNILWIDAKALYDLEKVSFKEIKKKINIMGDDFINGVEKSSVMGAYTPLARAVLLKDKSDFTTVLHELGHAFLEMTANINKHIDDGTLEVPDHGKARFKQLWQGMQEGIGADYWENGKPNERAHETYVNMFLRAVLDPNVDMPFKSDFKKWIVQSLKRRMGLGRSTKFTTQDATDYLKSQLALYGFNAVDIDNAVVDFASAISTVHDASIDVDMPSNKEAFSLLLDNPNLTDADRKEIADIEKQWQELERDVAIEHNKLEKVLFELNPTIIKTIEDLRNFYKDNGLQLSLNDGEIGLQALEYRYNNYLSSIKASIDKHRDNPRALATQLYTLNKEQASEFLNSQQLSILESKGRLSDTGLTIEQVNAEVYKNKRISNKTITLDLFYTSLTDEELKQYVHELAIQKLKADIEKRIKQTQRIRDYRVKKRLQLGRKEYALFNKLSNRGRQGTDYLKSLATLDVTNTTFTDLDPRQYIRQATEYRKQMLKALSLGQFREASVAKNRELLYLYKAEYATKVKDAYIEKLKDLAKFYKNKALTKATNGNTRFDFTISTIAKEMLVRAGVLRTNPTHRDHLAFAQTNDPIKFETFNSYLDKNIPYYKNMTVQDLGSFIDELNFLKVSASFLKKTELAEGERTLQQVKQDLLGTIGKYMDAGIEKPKELEGYANVSKTMFIDGMFSVIGKMSSYCKLLDGSENGAFSHNIYRPVRKATDQTNLDIYNWRETTSSIIEQYGEHIKKRRVGVIKTKQWLGFDLGVSAYARGNGLIELLGIVSHLGNPENQHALKLSLANYKPDITTEDLNNFFTAMIEQGYIDKELMDTIQGVWDSYAALFPRAQETYTKLNGKPMVKVQSHLVETPWGTYKGGYVPLLREKNATYAKYFEVMELNDLSREIEGSLGSNDPKFLATRTGWNGENAVCIDVQKLIAHGEKIIRYTNLQPALTDIKKLLDDREFSSIFDKFHPNARDKFMYPWLKAVANNQRSERPENMAVLYSFLNYLKKMSSAMLMGFNLNNTVQGTSQLASMATVAKPQYITMANQSVLLSYKSTMSMILEKSLYMQTRIKADATNMNMLFEKDFIIPSARGVNWETFKQHWIYGHNKYFNKIYFAQAFVQRRLDLIAWKAKYDQCIDEGLSEADAVALADDAVRETSMSSDVVDSSSLERSNSWVQLMTQFMPYFLTMANLTISHSHIKYKTAILNNKGKLVASLSILPTLVCSVWLPAVVAEVVNKTFTQSWEEEDDDAIFNPIDDTLIGAPLRTGFAMVPIFGTMGIQLLNDVLLDKHYYTDANFNMPSVTIARQAFKQLTDMAKDTQDGWDFKDSRDLAYLLALLTGNPFVVPAGKSAGVIADIIDGTIKPQNEWDWFMATMQGKPSKESQK